ncbi:2-dehydro-3-deoxyphosphooctonate aldolase 1 isoform X1 [Triticum aestivum]|uniref:2-dehydro-3-deoxyphosphooctonate aldolase 1 isoform X1 n=1 Tax=Triticum aestivum TaxID=4565 RepID=UPI001D00F866|nr:2-dehydro-3-deoxyphosphooctonate aldolase 1-like isoform X1 [Triticum aestivum]
MDAPSVALYNQLKAAQPFFLLAGPNVIESEEHILKMAKHIKAITTKLGVPLVFKSSFDKANRTSSKSFRGPGLEQGLKILEKVKAAYDLPVVTDVHESCQCEAVGRVADIIQIPAFLCRQTDLLVAAAKTGKIINIKKGQFCAPSVMANSAEKIRLAGNQNVMVCERGTMFGYNDLIVDPRNFELLREANCPVVADVTHALQQPAGKKLDGGGVASGGLRELIPCIARTAVAVGVDGIFMEVHDDPLNSPCDGPTQWVTSPVETFSTMVGDDMLTYSYCCAHCFVAIVQFGGAVGRIDCDRSSHQRKETAQDRPNSIQGMIWQWIAIGITLWLPIGFTNMVVSRRVGSLYAVLSFTVGF